MELVQLFLVIIVFWWIASFLTLELIPRPGPYVKRWLHTTSRACTRFIGRKLFLDQYHRRGLAHAAFHTWVVFTVLTIIGAIANPEADLWDAVALMVAIAVTAGYLLRRWHNLKRRKRRLPRRHTWY
jgi:hypothetical protein